MEPTAIETIRNELEYIKKENIFSNLTLRQGHSLYQNGQSQLLTQSRNHFEFSVTDKFDDFSVSISIDEKPILNCNCKADDYCHHKIACLMQLHEDLTRYTSEKQSAGKQYTRQGMARRVLEERNEKAKRAAYRIEFSDNIFGEHILFNEKAKSYKLTFRDFKEEYGYCSCPDYQRNKLGTCKHLIFAFNNFKALHKTINTQKQTYPFVEIFLDPLSNYQITWYYPHKLSENIESLINKYFQNDSVLPDDRIIDFLGFIKEAEEYKQIYIRTEVLEKIENAYNKRMLEQIKDKSEIDFSRIKATLFPYQKEGIKFAAFKEGAIIADEMGLGKTIQAIGIALIKKKLYDFSRTLIICPASLKDQWKREIERFSDKKACIVSGLPDERERLYEQAKEYFLIINYETVLRDYNVINKYPPDFIILDEAQRIKNYTTITATSIKSLNKKQSLVITGTPIENRLIDLYSIVDFIDPKFLSPLWEFSYQHCYFDHKQKNKITGYYNLQKLKERLSAILIRREKRDVIEQLPNISQIDIPVEMCVEQAEYHASYAKGISAILRKKFITPFDMQRLMMLLSKMRMVCDSTYLVDLETNFSPKLKELEHILFEKIDIKNSNRKIIIFSEWKRMNNIIGKMLRHHDIGFVELSGDVYVKNRPKLIKEFEDNDKCKVFISTEAGGVGLNLQIADTVINFELPWNPAKKNQRIGRIDRIGQTNKNLTIINLITKNSIEMKIASGLLLKQNLFEGVLSPNSNTEMVDFSKEGRAQFLNQLQEAMYDFENVETTDESETEDEQKPEDEKPISEMVEPVGEDNDDEDIFADEQIFENNDKEKNITEDMGHVTEKAENTSVFQESTENKAEEDIHKKDTSIFQKPTVDTTAKEETAKEVMETDESFDKNASTPKEQGVKELEHVMNQGMNFLSGLFKMATGKELSSSAQGIEINRETGEVTMKFKMPTL
ncbi:MAG: SNF2-related protein [bacterium]